MVEHKILVSALLKYEGELLQGIYKITNIWTLILKIARKNALQNTSTSAYDTVICSEIEIENLTMLKMLIEVS